MVIGNYAIMSDELYHHGIKGQKWGVRRFQNSDGSLTSAGRQRYGYGKGSDGSSNSQAKANNSSKTTPDTGNKKNKILNAKLNGKTAKGWKDLSPADKEAIVEVSAFTLATIAMPLAANAVVNHQMHKEQNENKKDNPFSDIKKTKPANKKEDDMKKINPNFEEVEGSTSNCALCTTAYDMRRRGYDVTANYSQIGRGIKDISKYYENTTKKDWVNSKKGEKNIMKAFDSMPDGSRGNICASVGDWASKHSMVWEKENGKITIRDCQENKTYDANNLFKKNGSKGIVRTDFPVQLLRTDNREINTKEIMDAVRPVNK